MKNFKKLLILRFSSMGDVAIMIPVLRALSFSYPKVNFVIASRPKMAPLFKEFKNINFFSVDIEKKYSGVIGVFKLFWALKSLRPSYVADLHAVIRTHILSSLFILFGTKVRSIYKGRKEKKALTRLNNKQFLPLTPTIFRYAKVFAELGFPVDITKEYPLKNKPLPEKLKSIFYYDNKKWIGIAPFASFEGKIYPLDLMQQVIVYLQKEHRIFLLGSGKKEEDLMGIWTKAYSNCWNASKELNFEEQLISIPYLDLMISMDSLNGHLAANAGIPVITIWGQTHPYSGFTPFNQPKDYSIISDREKFPGIPTSIYGNIIPKNYEDVFRSISPKTIIEKALEVLKK
ncbi:MAG: ADP-heptose--LPS heptosyltransferase RfaF [Flavobacteriaceae bacterium]|nr:ADP-heptose--LPS heptosyltransferase RfaF [Flavobacteriaceae bacterium]|tara:strand:- start:17754 stop:18788 length:1035 start_codon:yes stop_codon:yes gene_type:complete